MCERFAAKGSRSRVDHREAPVGVIGGEGCQRAQRFRLAGCFEPVADTGAGPRLPALERGQYVHIPEQDDGQGEVEQG